MNSLGKALCPARTPLATHHSPFRHSPFPAIRHSPFGTPALSDMLMPNHEHSARPVPMWAGGASRTGSSRGGYSLSVVWSDGVCIYAPFRGWRAEAIEWS